MSYTYDEALKAVIGSVDLAFQDYHEMGPQWDDANRSMGMDEDTIQELSSGEFDFDGAVQTAISDILEDIDNEDGIAKFVVNQLESDLFDKPIVNNLGKNDWRSLNDVAYELAFEKLENDVNKHFS